MELWKKNLWVLWCTQILSLASFGFGVPFIPLYIKELQTLTVEEVKLYATILAGAPAILMGIMAPIWGFLADKYGRKLMIMRAMIAGIILISLMGMVSSVNQLLFLRFLQGMFTGTVTASLAFVSANTPEKHLSYALGVISSSNFIGYSLGPALGGVCAEIYGYRMSFYIGGFVMFIGAMLVFFLVREDKSSLQKKEAKISIASNYKNILTPIIFSVLAALLFLRITRSLFSPYMPLFIENKLASQDGVSFLTGIVNALVGLTTALASILIGKFATNHNKLKTIFVLLCCSLSFSLLLANYSSIASGIGISGKNELAVFVALYILLFFSLGGVEPILTVIAAANVLPENRGALSGLHGMIGSIGWAISPVIAGTIVYGRSIELILYALPVMISLNLVLSFFLKRVNSTRR